MRSRPDISSFAAAVAAAAILVTAAPSVAQQPAHAHQAGMPTSGIRAELIRDIEDLERKYLGLADAMTGKYGWRPGEGVRSVGEVFMHVAGANLYLPIIAGVEAPEMHRVANLQEAFPRMQVLEKEMNEATVKATLRTAFTHAKHAVATIADAQLDDAADIFGQSGTKRAALTMLVTHMHEHLGQSIAYARMNGVIPPWSANAGN